MLEFKDGQRVRTSTGDNGTVLGASSMPAYFVRLDPRGEDDVQLEGWWDETELEELPDPTSAEGAEPEMDVAFLNEGSISILSPKSDAAQEWFEEYVEQDGGHWCGGYVVEHRYVDAILQGLDEAGLTVGIGV